MKIFEEAEKQYKEGIFGTKPEFEKSYNINQQSFLT